MMNRHRRTASTYVMVLGTGMIVMVIGLSALTAIRVQRNAARGDDDLVQARLNARTALEVGLQKMGDIADWRNQLPNGDWYVNQPFAGGTFSLNGVDPGDADLTDSPLDPVLLTGIGGKGAASYRLQVTVESKAQGLNCLEAALHAGSDVSLTNINLISDAIISANGNVTESGSVVDADVEAVGTISGIGYTRSVTEGMTARTMPDPVSVFDYYLTNGTTIDINSLPDGGANLLANPGFENGTTDWLDMGAIVLQLLGGDPHGGLQHLSFVGATGWSGPRQDISTRLSSSGTTYHSEAWVRIIGALPADVQMGIETADSTAQLTYTLGPRVSVGATWTQLSADLVPIWGGTLGQAHWYIDTKAPLNQVHIDDTFLSQASVGRTIRYKGLSPTGNPFGGGTNAEGIYVIDCGGQDLFIEDSQITGTLVILNPGPGSKIIGPRSWQAAVANFPVLMVSGNMRVEGKAVVAPVPTDAVSGLVYTTGNLSHIGREVDFTGAVIVGGSFLSNADKGGYTYNSIYLSDPPPGFNEQPQMVVQPGSWRPLVN